MAKEGVDRPIELPPEILKRLRDLKPEIEKARANLELLKEMGIDAKKLEENVIYAEKMIDIVSKRVKGGL